MEKKEPLNTEFIKFWFEDGIVFGIYKKNIDIDIQVARQIVADRIKFCGNNDYPHHLDISGIKSTSKDARDYFSVQGIQCMSSLALLTDSPVSRIIGNFFLMINNPKVPTKLFTETQEAKKWLHNLREKVQV